jgi:23S rRNA (uracil747-C5)-methyltransferase
MAQKLYKTAAQWAKELKIEKFAELFCGQGAFSFFMAPHVRQAVGLEINAAAVAEANATARQRSIANVSFVCADAANAGRELNHLSPDLVLVNPPRRGLGESLALFKEKAWPYLLYSSCSLESLAKDLQELQDLYEIKQVQLFDMFPHTEHFETLVLLKAKTCASY